MSVFLIGGINRSGTTLLQSILCSDESTNPLIHEASYLRNIVEAYVFGLQKYEEHNKYYFSSRDDLKEFTARWAGEFLKKTQSRYPDAKHLVLKHPPLTPRFPALFELLESLNADPRFFIVVRDPRDVAASLVRVGEKLRGSGESEGNTLPRDMTLLSNYYMQCYSPALTSNNIEYKKRVTLIKYEDLVSKPEGIIESLRKSSGLDLKEFNANDNWKKDNIDYDNLKETNNAWLSDLWGKQLSSSRIGSYKNILNQNEINTIENICSGPLSTFGYK